MLTYLLADVVAIASIGLFVGAFLLPSFKRESDVIWGGVGLFYALVLFACAGQVRGGLLLGQIAGVSLMGWLGWQAFRLRWQDVPEVEKQKVQGVTNLAEKVKGIDVSNLKLDKLGDQAKGLMGKVKDSASNVDLGKLGDQAKGMTDKVKDAASNVDLGKLGDQAKGMTDKVKDAAASVSLPTVEKVKDTVTQAVTKTADVVVETAEAGRDAVVDATETVVEKVAEVVDDMKKAD